MALIYNNQENVEQILQILRNREQILQVAALEQAGNPVAERVMDAGKRVCSVLPDFLEILTRGHYGTAIASSPTTTG